MVLRGILTLAASLAAAAGLAGAGERPVVGSTITGTAGDLAAVAAIPGTTHAWAVGHKCTQAGACPAFILRQTGSGWTAVKAPSPGGQVSLTAVAASSPSQAWAVGSDTAANQNLFLHWTGSHWTRVTAPGKSDESLNGVSVTSPVNAWAAGTYQSPALNLRTLIQRWDGRAWKNIKTPDPISGEDQLMAITAVSGSDAWAVGYGQNTATSLNQTLILHWNGTAWATATSPHVASLGTELTGVTAISATDAWAVGQYGNPSDFDSPLILHWNGSTWARVAVSAPRAKTETLLGVTATSATSAWTVGYGPCTGGSVDCPSPTLTLRWHDHAWDKISSPSVADASDHNTLAGAAATSALSVWAVGGYFPAEGSPARVLLLHWNGTSWVKQ